MSFTVWDCVCVRARARAHFHPPQVMKVSSSCSLLRLASTSTLTTSQPSPPASCFHWPTQRGGVRRERVVMETEGNLLRPRCAERNEARRRISMSRKGFSSHVAESSRDRGWYFYPVTPSQVKMSWSNPPWYENGIVGKEKHQVTCWIYSWCENHKVVQDSRSSLLRAKYGAPSKNDDIWYIVRKLSAICNNIRVILEHYQKNLNVLF